ncbi:amidase (plasmid) [Bernardetia sp. Wsw4-3y2]|uniref:amidase n=1 Tax=Bernardetia sp. Wsw4-3y2 TaxID=3127471 RepID=UPI0030D381F6
MKDYNFTRPIDKDTHEFSDATSLLKDFENGKTTSLNLVEKSLRNIADNHERLNAMIQLFAKEALEEAKKSTEKDNSTTQKRGKLEGIPISLKEPIGLEGQEVTGGSMRMPAKIAEKDALVVQRLKKEGAIIIARTNTPEFSFGHETRSPRFGVTNNPYVEGYIPGGSSGGESALIASGGSVIGIGTDVGGSIRYPAHCCGLVGFKPSGRAVSKKGIFPFIEREDFFLNDWLAVGPITHSVRDAKLVYEVIADKIPTDSNDLSNAELIISTDFDTEIRNETIKEVLIKAKQSLLNEGLQPKNITIENIGKIHWNFGKMMIKAMKLGLKDWLRNDKDVGISVFVESLRRVIGEKTVSGEIYSVLLASKFLEPSDKELNKMIQFYQKEKENLYKKIGQRGVLLLPTSGDIALKHQQTMQIDMSPLVPNIFSPMIFTNVMDLPSITIPAWKYRDRKTGLPTSVMLCCLPNSENLLFEAASKLESILN